jgi:hypothetical protein
MGRQAEARTPSSPGGLQCNVNDRDLSRPPKILFQTDRSDWTDSSGEMGLM